MANDRIGQRDILPSGVRRRNEHPLERAYSAIISPPGRNQVGEFSDIQKAFDYVRDLGGGSILVLPGTYQIPRNLVIYSNTQLIGLVTAGCIFDFNRSTYNLATEPNPVDIRIENMTFKNCWNTTVGTIYLNGTGGSAQRITIINCKFDNNKNGSNQGYDIYATISDSVLVTRCFATNGATFYFANNSADINEVSFNNIEDYSDYIFEGGSTGNGAGQTKYDNNYILDSINSVFFGKFSLANIINNRATWGSATLTQIALDFNSSNSMKVVGNDILASTGGHVAMDLNACNQNQFSANRFLGSEASTPIINLDTSDANVFTGNYIDTDDLSDGMDGIKLTTSDRNVITGNYIDGSSGGTAYGVNISNSTSDNNTVVGNFLNAVTGDTNDAGTGSTIASND